jgi:tRNA threonylcarbamoyladenosine biosynthesis protein TsaB
MKMLAIESSGAVLSLALFKEGQLKKELSRQAAMRQNESLAPLVAEILETAQWKASELAAVAISLGPGSFTGLRTGLAFAKGLCFASKAKLIGIPTLEAWAEGQAQVEVWLDARRGMVYRGSFQDGQALKESAMLELSQAKAELPQGVTVLGDLQGSGAPSAASLGRLALKRLQQGQHDDPALLEPIYLRRPEAEILWERRHGA